ncbi:hypothetical protein POM88_001448 [Heracleum sosnowskyi]|uniref:beta-glucosidase n=1 Tax=Heracleum sosnowskyi TaxID=360622 RepID=A0AAD8JDK5_9APIA|nr:hypothetical protein POM88_001448 [Heracleum sosnowskyi]
MAHAHVQAYNNKATDNEEKPKLLVILKMEFKVGAHKTNLHTLLIRVVHFHENKKGTLGQLQRHVNTYPRIGHKKVQGIRAGGHAKYTLGGHAKDHVLVKNIGAATALEARATGIPYVFAPCIAVCRDPRWGRCYESYSEDHKIVQAMTEIIPGLQGDIPYNSRKGVPFLAGLSELTEVVSNFDCDLSMLLLSAKDEAKFNRTFLLNDRSVCYFLSLQHILILPSQLPHCLIVFSQVNNIQQDRGFYTASNGYLVTEVIQFTRKFGQWQENGEIEGPAEDESYDYVEAVKLTGDPDVLAGQASYSPH